MQISRGSALAAGLAAAVAVLLMLTPGCSRGKQSASLEPPLALRSYQVTPEQGPELSSIINQVLDRGDDAPPAGRAQLGPNGLLVVAAPEDLLDQVDRLVAEVGKQAPSAPPMVTITYWVVVGHPATATAWSPGLDEVKEALDAITSTEGPTAFQLLEKARVASLSGESTASNGNQVQIRQRASTVDGHVVAEIDVRAFRPVTNPKIATRVSLTPGKLLVLGQSGFAQEPLAAPFRSGTATHNEGSGSIYYLVRAQVDSSSESPA